MEDKEFAQFCGGDRKAEEEQKPSVSVAREASIELVKRAVPVGAHGGRSF